MKLETGCESIDELLQGGIESGIITELYGEGGSGKTNLCLQLARNCARNGKKVVYIDTEGVSFERLQQICGEDFEKVVRNIIFFNPYNLKEQEAVVGECVKIVMGAGGVGLVVLDSATTHYRESFGSEADGASEVDALHSLSRQICALLEVARRCDIPVVVTNHVYTNIVKKDIEPLGGHLLRHVPKAILKLERLKKNRRIARIMKHRSLSEDISAEFVITQNGLEGKRGFLKRG